MKYIIDLPEDQQIMFMDGKHMSVITPEKQEMSVFDADTIGTSVVKLTPYDESGEIQKGWNLAGAISYMNDHEIEEDFCISGWTRPIECVLETIGYPEAKEKYEKWKKWKESKEKFRIGDEAILADGRRFIVGTVLSDGRLCGSGISYCGLYDSWSNVDPKSVTKGRHFPEFKEMLKRLSEC